MLFDVMLFAFGLTIIISMLLAIIFVFMPRSGMINCDIAYEKVEFNKALCNGKIKTRDIWVYADLDLLKMRPYTEMVVNGISLSSGSGSFYTVKVINYSDHESGEVHFVFEEEVEVQVYHSAANGDITVKPRHIQFRCPNNDLSLETKNTCQVRFVNCYGILLHESYNFSDKVEISEMKIETMTLTYAGASFYQEDEDEYYTPDITEYLSIGWDGKEELTIWQDPENTEELHEYMVNQVSANGIGIVSLFTTAKMQEYEVRGNISSEGELNLLISDGKLKYEGIAWKAAIMGYSIFPGFIDWIHDNAYLIPSMILTVISGAIVLAVNKMKK